MLKSDNVIILNKNVSFQKKDEVMHTDHQSSATIRTGMGYSHVPAPKFLRIVGTFEF